MPIKPTDQVLLNIQKDIIGVRRAIANEEIISEGKNTPIGKSLYEMFKLIHENADMKLGGFLKASDKEVTAALQEKATAKFFMDLFDKDEQNMDDLKERLAALLIREKSYRAKLATS